MVSPRSTQIINDLLHKGMRFTVATARTPATVVPLLQQLDLDIPAVLMNGAVLYDIRRKHYIRANGFTDNSALNYIDLLEKRDLVPFVYRIDNNKLHVFHKPLSNEMQREFKRQRENTPYKDFVPVDRYAEPLLDRPPLFILVIDRFDRLETAAAEIGRAGQCSIFCYRDIVDPSYGQPRNLPAGGLQGIDRPTDCRPPQPLGGGGLRRQPQRPAPLPHADRRYAPENAMDEVKRQATAIIPDNNHDGVARFLYDDYL